MSRRDLLITGIGAAAVVGLGFAGQDLLARTALAATGAQLPFPNSINHNNPFGKGNWYNGVYLNHRGTDFAPPSAAYLPVPAAAPGVITMTNVAGSPGSDSAFGNWVEIYHGTDGAGNEWWTRYHMLWEENLPAAGAIVEQGATIGYIDNYHSTNWFGAHVHFEVCTTAADAGTAYTGYYLSGTRRCVDPLANIHRVPTHNYTNTPPETIAGDIDLPIIIVRPDNNHTYTVQPGEYIKHHNSAFERETAEHTYGRKPVSYGTTGFKVALRDMGFPEVGDNINLLPSGGAIRWAASREAALWVKDRIGGSYTGPTITDMLRDLA